MGGYNVSIDEVRIMSHLNIEFEEIIRKVMMSQGRTFCSFKEKKCESDERHSLYYQIENTINCKDCSAKDKLDGIGLIIKEYALSEKPCIKT